MIFIRTDHRGAIEAAGFLLRRFWAAVSAGSGATRLHVLVCKPDGMASKLVKTTYDFTRK